MQKRDWLHAKEDFEQVLRMSPNYPGARERLDMIRRELGKLPK